MCNRPHVDRPRSSLSYGQSGRRLSSEVVDNDDVGGEDAVVVGADTLLLLELTFPAETLANVEAYNGNRRKLIQKKTQIYL